MKRYEMIAYYEDRASSTRVAQKVVVLEANAKSAVEAVKVALAPFAVNGHLAAIEIKDSDQVETGVVFKGEPYIPLHWPFANRQPELVGVDAVRGNLPAAGSFPAQFSDDESPDEI